MTIVPEKRGERISGSKYIRDFCLDCGEPLRVISLEYSPRYCCDCAPGTPNAPGTGLTLRQRLGSAKTK